MSRRLIAALLALGIWTAGCNVVGPLPAPPFMRPLPAALDVLECDLARSTMGGAGEVLSNSGWPTPDQAVADLVDDGWVMPRTGYQLEAADAHQALYVFRNGPAVKLALLVSDDEDVRNGGWAVIELRACQTAEFGPQADLGPDVELWADPDGHVLQARRGPSHCDWQDALILHWRRYGADDSFRSMREYVRDPTGVFQDHWAVPYDSDTALPADATDTRYQHAGARLWMAADRQSVYVVNGRRVERWPLVPGGIGCA
jgi:hypothetical protein